MAITPGAGYMIDPNNPNRVIPIGSAATVNNPNYSYNAPAAQTPTYAGGNTGSIIPQYNPAPQQYNPTTVAPPPVPDSLYTMAQGAVKSGSMTPQQAQQQLQGYISSGQYSGSIDINKIAPTGFTYSSTPAPVNQDFFLKPNETIAQYNARIAASNPNLPAPGTTSSTGVTNTATAAVRGQAYTPPSSISSANLAATPTQSFQSSPALPNYSSTLGLDGTPQISETPQEQKQSSLGDLIQSLNTQEAGKAGDQNAANAAAGVPELTRLVNDFSSQLKVSQLEAANIQQTTQTGEGVTTAIDQRQRAEALRLNSVKSLGIYAQLQMAQGNLATAQDAADKAVALKYDPIEASLAAAKSNLAVIANDPLTSVQDKNRALQTQSKLDAQSAAIAQQKSDASKIWDIYFQAATNGLTDVTKLNAIKNATSPEQALQIAAEAGVAGKAGAPKIIGSASSGYYTVNADGTVTPLGVGGNNSPGKSPSSSSSSSGGYQAGQLTALLQSKGIATDDKTLKSLYFKATNKTDYVNDAAHNAEIYKYMGGTVSTASTVSRPDPKSNYTATSIPSSLQTELLTNIKDPSVTLAELYAAYPDVSTAYVSSLFNSLRKTSGGITNPFE